MSTAAPHRPATGFAAEDPLAGLPLTRPTAPGWAGIALQDPMALLRDHAHCELKAASFALGLLGRHPGVPALARPLRALAREEMRHYHAVHDLLQALDARPGRPGPDRYVRRLRRSFCSEGSGLGALGDQLLVAAFIEARSCERFRLLAAALRPHLKTAGDPTGPPAPAGTTLEGAVPPGLSPGLVRRLGGFYARLARAEARHWEMFKDLAEQVLPRGAVARRMIELGPLEAGIVNGIPASPRIH